MFGPGRPSKAPNLLEVRELTQEQVDGFTPTSKDNRIKKLRDSHHRIAHLFAMGFRNQEIAEITGYSDSRLAILRKDPAIANLVELYRPLAEKDRQAEMDEYFLQVTRARKLAMGEIVDRLTDSVEDFTISQLVAVHADAADRTGYPKRSMSLNVNFDLAAKLDAAIKRQKGATIIDATPRLMEGKRGRELQQEPPVSAAPVPLLRRV